MPRIGSRSGLVTAAEVCAELAGRRVRRMDVDVGDALPDGLDDGRETIIFPEGTRRPPGAPPDYKTGIVLLYDALGVPCLPVALNSGLFWPRRSVIRRPGTIVVEILPPIPPGLPRDEFLRRLQLAIEGASSRLLVEAGAPEPVRA